MIKKLLITLVILNVSYTAHSAVRARCCAVTRMMPAMRARTTCRFMNTTATAPSNRVARAAIPNNQESWRNNRGKIGFGLGLGVGAATLLGYQMKKQEEVVNKELTANNLPHSFLYAPWRTHYQKPADTKQTALVKKPACFICHDLQETDEKNFILKRFTHCYVFLNRFPYTSGHLMVVPYQHSGTLDALTPACRAEMMEVATQCSTILTKAFNADGVNLGFNIGKCSGASAPDHLHQHIVPRRSGDINFIERLDNTTVIECDLPTMYKRLKPHFETGN